MLVERHPLSIRNQDIEKKDQLSTAEVIALLNSLYLNLYHGPTDALDLAQVGKIWDKYPLTLYGGRCSEKRTADDIIRAMKYAFRRLPIEVYSNLNADINLSNDWGNFETNRAKPHSRSRWHRVQDRGDDNVAVVMQVRSKTDHHEILGLLAVMENARSYFNRGNITPGEIALLKSEFVALCKEQGIEEEEAKVYFSNFMLGRRALIKGENPYSLSDLYKDKGRRAARATLEIAEERLGELDRVNTVFFSNDFILRNMLSLNMLEAMVVDSGLTLEGYLDEKIGSDGTEFEGLRALLTKYTESSDTLADKDDLTLLAVKFAKIQFISKYNGADPIINKYKEILCGDVYLEALGFKTLVGKEESPITDPVRHIDFGKLADDSVFFNYPVLGDLIRALKDANINMLMTPYALGDLSFGLGHELLIMNDKVVVIETGKVGCFEDDEENMTANTLKRGYVVSPEASILATAITGAGRSLNNMVSAEDAMGICQIQRHRQMVTTRAVVAQTFDDANRKLFVRDGQITLDMEGSAFADLLAAFPDLKTIFVNYISDFSRKDGSEAISDPLGADGWLAVLFSTIIALKARCRLNGVSC